MILVATLGLALVLGLVSGGRFRLLECLRLKGETALVALLVLQLLAPLLASRLGLPKAVTLSLWCVALVGSAGLCFWNSRLRGLWLAALGSLLNAAVVGANLGMPVDSNAYTRWAGGAALALPASDHLHVVLGPATRLPFLADILAFPGPRPLASLVSVGDVLLLVGIAVLLSSALVGDQWLLAMGGASGPTTPGSESAATTLQEMASEDRT